MTKECYEVKCMCEKCKYRRKTIGGYKCNLFLKLIGKIKESIIAEMKSANE